jgi:adenylosuccinate lyase
MVQRNALRAAEALGFGSGPTRGPGSEAERFRDLLAADPDIRGRLSPEEIDRACDLGHHLRHAADIIDRALLE